MEFDTYRIKPISWFRRGDWRCLQSLHRGKIFPFNTGAATGMLWKCMVSVSNHCEVGRQWSSTRDLFNAIIYSAGRVRPWITGTGVCTTVLSLLLGLTGSCTGLTAGHFGSLMFAFAGAILQPTSVPRCDRRPGARASQGWTRFATLYTDVYWRRRRVREMGLFENRTAKIDSLKISSIILLNYWITVYVTFRPHLETLPRVVCCL